MDDRLNKAFGFGYERLAAWSDLLDEINLYPVPDADTGRNLKISLAPLKAARDKDLSKHLLMSATGNSGNIAGAFFSQFTRIKSIEGIPDATMAGNDAAWKALQDPQPGTMLTVFSALSKAWQEKDMQLACGDPDPVIDTIKRSVLATTGQLSQLRKADVVDSGALGMFLFFEGFLRSLAGQSDQLSNPYTLFGDKITIDGTINEEENEAKKGFCIDTVLIPSSDMDHTVEKITAMGQCVVTVSDGRQLKVHLHANDLSSAKKRIADMGELVGWKSEKIESRIKHPASRPASSDNVHIVTDAAGSISLETAKQFGITLLDSYIIMEDRHLPESLVSGPDLYQTLIRGKRVTTAQASLFERHQHYDYLTERFSNLIYLCVGSAYTGNYGVACQWAADNPKGERMTVIDTGAASGRLGLIARTVAAYANSGATLAQIIEQARSVLSQCDELIFLDQLKYLAASGRISRPSRFFGDLLKIKPIIRPGAQGAQKVGAAKNEAKQVEFLLSNLDQHLDKDCAVEVLLQYTDNQDRVMSQIRPRIQTLLPHARITLHPMSLTSGVHMGPGTWAVAYMPGNRQ